MASQFTLCEHTTPGYLTYHMTQGGREGSHATPGYLTYHMTQGGREGSHATLGYLNHIT